MSSKNNPHQAFNVILAVELTLPLAILVLNHFQYWIKYNRIRNKNCIDQRTWINHSLEEIASQFPYWPKTHVERLIETLVSKGILIKRLIDKDTVAKGDFNKNKVDHRTSWYAFKDEKRFSIDEKKFSTLGENNERCKSKLSRRAKNKIYWNFYSCRNFGIRRTKY